MTAWHGWSLQQPRVIVRQTISPTSIQLKMITVVLYPATVQWSLSFPDPLAEDTDTSVPAVALRTNHIAVGARDAREIYSLTRVSCGAEFGSPPMGFALSK